MIIKARLAKSIVSRTKGLIGDRRIEPLFLQTRFGIHTFGMKKPIDVVIVDDENKVRDLKKRLRPGRIFVWNPKFKNVLELPNGFISDQGIQKGDVIKLELTEQPG
jgi:uncharacterized protein